ncbi:MAG: methionine--tRNA ligase [Acidobacteria bacterium]|jgi:methionyl-tRNA synthetase|nr:methionine--tRNA ligase [Acidobacteriota bacterium]
MTEKRSFLVTTPIYYVNAEPHVGHAYTTIAADALTRARRLGGHDVFFVTGTDEHGQNIERIARERGIPEQQHCDEIAAVFRSLWERLDIRYDRFIRTTEEEHRRGVLKLWGLLVEAQTPDGQDAVYQGTYSGWYCPRCEGFKDEDELQQPDNVCPDHELPCEWTEEQNFFFRLSAYEEWLREQIESDRLLIRPESRKNEILGVIRQGLKDFSVSRARVKWGIPVPEEPDHVLYVWVDALSNYITALGFADDGENYRRFWCGAHERLHLIGKDIIRFHCLYWPAILHAAGLPVPTREFGQGFITKDGRKLSKTTGNVIDPAALAERLGPDAARYFLLREAPYGADWDFTDAAFVGRYNADLANDLGNLVSRALTMVSKFGDGKVPPRPASVSEARGLEEELQTDAPVAWPYAEGRRAAVLARYEAIDFSGALAEVWSWISQLNQRIVAVEPWTLARDPSRRDELDAFLYRLLEGVRLVAVLASPVMPRAAGRIDGMLGRADRAPGPDDLEWGRLEPGTSLGTVVPLFPRIEKKDKEKNVPETTPPAAVPSKPEEAPAPAAGPERIDIADFARLELRAAKVTAAEQVEGSKKLLKLQVDLGTETRQVVAGIAQTHAPEDVVGKTVVLVANLKPAKLMGVESNGMVLAGSVDGRAVLCQFEGEVAPGTRVR